MDDPWGSPWAAADGDQAHRTSRGRARSPAGSDVGLGLDLAPPKPAFRPAGSPAHSPWADGGGGGDDDGFGDWASAPGVGAAADNIWGGWAGDGGPSASPHPTLTPRDEEPGQGSPIAWPGSVAASPGAAFRPLSRKLSSLSRASADDPWAAEPSFNALPPLDHTVQPPLSVDAHAHALQDIEENNEGAGLGLAGTPDNPGEGDGQEGEDIRANRAGSRPPSRSAAAGPTPTIHIQAEEEQEAPVQPPAAAEHEPAVVSDAASLASRPSSRGSDGSRRDHDERQDSPITSVDEDGRTRPQVARKGSSKVQELVDMFDGMVQREATPEPQPATGDRRRAGAGDQASNAEEEEGEEDGEDDDAEFGDFEDPLSRQPSKQPSGVPSPERLPTPEPADPDTPASPRARLGDTSSRPGTRECHAGPSRVDQLVAKYGPIEFDVDPAGVDKLFDAEKLASVRPPSTTDAGTEDVSDHVITDSFATISERKTWYRVSRQGPARRHDAGGDDESYRRVAWPTSQVRADTIHVVRRWMEEDSIGGRPILGGAGSKANAFGWDSTAEPVTLEQVFGKRRRAAHARQPSVQSLGSVPSPLTSPARRRGSLQGQSPRQAQAASPKAAVRGPAAQFGWNSAPGEMTAPLAPPVASPTVPHPPASQPGMSRPAVPSSTSTQPIQTPPAGPEKAPSALAPAPIITGRPPEPSTTADDDDEWGEMVMSPPGDDGPGDAFGGTSPGVPPATGASGFGGFDDSFGAPGPHQATVVGTPLPPTSLAGLVSPVSAPSPSSFFGHGREASVPAASADPWDLSFFDATAPPSAPPPARAAIPPAVESTPASPGLSARPKVATAPASVPDPAPTPEGPSSTASPTAEQARLARSIISGLPDLSYMLR